MDCSPTRRAPIVSVHKSPYRAARGSERPTPSSIEKPPSRNGPPRQPVFPIGGIENEKRNPSSSGGSGGVCYCAAFCPGPAAHFAAPELDRLLSRIALYPDPLLAQILAAATYPDQIPDAARWADQHHYLTGQALADAISADQLPWDPSVQALLPFPSVLDMLASDMNWTSQLGNAFLAQQQDVMDAVQRLRRQATDFGYLRSNGSVIVSGGPYIAIAPVNPGIVYVPYYDPALVFVAPRPGFVVGGAIRFGFA
jgi:hypothetical protein